MNWIKIFASEVEARNRIHEGKPQLLVVNGKRICLLLFKGEFHAVQDGCTHSGASLSQGHLNYLGEIICPLHSYQFDIRSGTECQSRSRDLETFPIKIDESGFFIAL